MPYCKQCGAEVEQGEHYCASCGSPIDPQPSEFQQKVEDFAHVVQDEVENAPDYTMTYHPDDIAANRGMAVLCYFGLLLLIPYLRRKDSPYVRFHLNQGLIMLIVSVVSQGVERVLNNHFGMVGSLSAMVLSLVVFALFLMGVIRAASGKAKELPFVGQFRLLK